MALDFALTNRERRFLVAEVESCLPQVRLVHSEKAALGGLNRNTYLQPVFRFAGLQAQ